MDTTVTSAGPLMAGGLTEQMWRDVLVRLRAFVRRRIADPVRAEDLVGEILLRIHQNLDSIGDRERLANWVFRVARNAIVDEYRRAARAREQLVPTLVEGAVEEPGSDAEDEPGVLEELAGCLRPLLGGLPVEQRRAVELIDLDGVPQARAAQDEGVSLSGMKSRVQRGRRRLGELLGQCCALTLDARGMPMEYVAPRSCDCGR
jgi:RNA polymerase sigma-70 factor, ECF subfamily